MQPIPTPEVLDPDRLLREDRTTTTQDERSQAELLREALQDSCDYARQLWRCLDGIRRYLMTSLPPDPRSPGGHPAAAASPTGPDDDEGWDSWIGSYATVNSILCGPQGDAGFGLGEARHAAELRRGAPVSAPRMDNRESGTRPEPSSGQRPDPGWSRLTRRAATVVLVLLAIRGLRPTPRQAGGGRADL